MKVAIAAAVLILLGIAAFLLLTSNEAPVTIQTDTQRYETTK